ncbi:MAG: hypothetical protein ABJG42_24205 [Vibrio splendidus]
MTPNDIVIETNLTPTPRFSLIDEMRVERGSKADWDELHALHYKAESLPAGARYWRCITSDDELVGIVVTSSVSLLLAPRHKLFPKLKPGNDTHLTNVHRAKWLNRNFRRAARIVTDTMYRGVGISYRMLNLASRLEGFRFMEIQSSMSKFNPFDAKAGFQHAHLGNNAAYEQGIKFFGSYFGSHPADHDSVIKEYQSKPESIQKIIIRDTRQFYYRHSAKEKTGSNLKSGTSKVDAMPFDVLIKELQQLVFASPVYGVYQNPDMGTVLPSSLPLSAFDKQLPNQPLAMDSKCI